MATVKTVARRGAERDIYLVNGRLAMCEGLEAYRQILEAAIRTQRGELVLDVDRGIPYFETVFDRPQNVYLWADAVKKRTKQFPWVEEIVSFDYDIDHANHVLTYTMKVKTDIGTITLSN